MKHEDTVKILMSGDFVNPKHFTLFFIDFPNQKLIFFLRPEQTNKSYCHAHFTGIEMEVLREGRPKSCWKSATVVKLRERLKPTFSSVRLYCPLQ